MNQPTTSDPPSDFELEVWSREASSLITCTGCFGSGQRYRHDRERDSGRWELCERCQGSARCEAEPHVMRLIAEVRRLKQEKRD